MIPMKYLVAVAAFTFDSAWPAYRDPIEQQVRPFVDGRITYEEMATNLATALR
jgi:hypothetical protein